MACWPAAASIERAGPACCAAPTKPARQPKPIARSAFINRYSTRVLGLPERRGWSRGLTSLECAECGLAIGEGNWGSFEDFAGFGSPTTVDAKPEGLARCQAAIKVAKQLGLPRSWVDAWRLFRKAVGKSVSVPAAPARASNAFRREPRCLRSATPRSTPRTSDSSSRPPWCSRGLALRDTRAARAVQFVRRSPLAEALTPRGFASEPSTTSRAHHRRCRAGGTSQDLMCVEQQGAATSVVDARRRRVAHYPGGFRDSYRVAVLGFPGGTPRDPCEEKAPTRIQSPAGPP